MKYSKEVQDRIRKLEKEIESIKKEATSCAIIDSQKCKDIAYSSGHYYDTYYTRICYIAKAACTGSVEKMIGGKRTKTVKKTDELTQEEIDIVKRCTSDILDVLQKYIIKNEG